MHIALRILLIYTCICILQCCVSSVPDWSDDDTLLLLDHVKARWADISEKGYGSTPNTIIFQEIGDEIMHENVPAKLRGKDCIMKWNNLKAEHKKRVVCHKKSGQGAVKPSIFDEPIDAILGNELFLAC